MYDAGRGVWRWLSVILAALSVAVVPATVPTAAAQQASLPSVTLEPSTAAPGQMLTLHGAGWPAGATLTATVYEASDIGGPGASASMAIPVAPDGQFVITGQVPRTLMGSGSRGTLAVVPGAYAVVVRQGATGPTATASLTVGAPTDGALIWGEVAFDRNGNGVRDEADQTVGPLAGVWMDALPAESPPRGIVDARGRFALSPVEAGPHMVSTFARLDDAAWMGVAAVDARSGEATRRDVLLQQVPEAPSVARDAQYFAETGFRVDDAFWSYFNARGAIGVFGYPVSRVFQFLGCPVQVFQRQVAQFCPGQGVQLLNLLDPDIFPYTRVNGSTFPAPDPALKEATPKVGDPDYATSILDFVREHAPDAVEGEPVGFQTTFFGLITPEMAGTDDPAILGLMNLEVWGAPISQPMADPTNAAFIYQRFQRGIMHYDADSEVTGGILLADYLKHILRGGIALPPDLRQQAGTSRYFAQYCPGAQAWLCRPTALPGTDLTFAFEMTPPN